MWYNFLMEIFKAPGNNPRIVTIGVIVVAIVVFAIGFWVGNGFGLRAGTAAGAQTAAAQYQSLLNLAFPAPAAVLTRARAQITGIRGSVLTVSMADPNDYLPNTSGAPSAQVTKTVTVGPNTQILRLNYSQMSSAGLPAQTPLQVSDLKTGDIVVVTTDANIRSSNAFVANQILLAVY